ncbi:MFS transporter permease [Nonlabens sp. YIK11]|uniref:MFS transporter n=1 Tax=Nonlabens sp. YIK11 TaxID=1453349 RepID=UPI0006DCE044|nr:MFS transporter [Nonlabens sp. YIK11]KQC33763.1 MFS transporter permease [Nonlabens sp. YIK11]
MNQNATAEPKLSNTVLYLMSISAGLVVANIYYNQPLLNLISQNLGVSQASASNVALATQLGYAAGLLIIIPLGDKFSNKLILKYDFFILVISLLVTAVASNIYILIASSFVIGFASVIPQLFVPMAARLSEEAHRGRAIGIVMSGLLIGILASRTISGVVGEYFGWRAIFYIAAGLMVLLFILLHFKLPKLNPTYEGSYLSLFRSIAHYFKTEPTIRVAALRGGLGFAAISVFWTTLVFLLEDSFGYGSDVAGYFGLIGVVGAMGATVTGKLNDTMNKYNIILSASIILLISWILFYFSGNSILGLIIGVVLIDLGMQALHITNQNIIFSKNKDARNRINTIYMVGFFVGGALGTLCASIAWENYGWPGVSVLGIVLSAAILGTQLVWGKNDDK